MQQYAALLTFMLNPFLMTSTEMHHLFNNFSWTVMQRKSVNTFLQPDLCASRSLRANSSYVNRISHDIIVTEDQQMDIVNIALASFNVSMLRLCALPQYAGAWLTAVRLTGRRLHKGTDAL